MPNSYLGHQGLVHGLNGADAFWNKMGATVCERNFCGEGSATAYFQGTFYFFHTPEAWPSFDTNYPCDSTFFRRLNPQGLQKPYDSVQAFFFQPPSAGEDQYIKFRIIALQKMTLEDISCHHSFPQHWHCQSTYFQNYYATENDL